MKIIGKGILVFLISISILVVKVQASENELFETVNNKVMSFSSNDDLKETSDGYLYINKQGITYIYNNIKVLELKEEYLCHVTDNEYLYLITKKIDSIKISKINKSTKKSQNVLSQIDNPTKIKIIDNELIIIGSDKKDAVICKYDKNLTYLHCYYYGGTASECFNDFYEYDNDYYLVGKKDAHSENSPFLNVGNLNEQKVFLTKINKQGIIIDTIYFNHQAPKEEIINSQLQNNKLVVNIKANDLNHIYYLSTKLKTLEYFVQNMQEKTLNVVSNTSNYLTIKEENNLKLIVREDVYDLKVQGNLKYVEMKDNILNIYYYNDYYLWKMEVYQYKIIKQEDIIINRVEADFNEQMDMNEIQELKVESVIHNIDLQLERIEPYFNKQIHGEYQATFKIIINQNKKYFINNKIIIEEFINIINNHTYPIGYSIKFTGHAFLDEKTIVSGYKINEEGIHNLVIIDALGNKNKYTFKVVNSGYYQKKDTDLDYIKPDEIVNKNQELILKILTNKPVNKVYINEESVEFKNIDSGITINLPGFNKIGMNEIKINRIEYLDDTIDVNKSFFIRVLKDAPIVEITENTSNNLTFNMNISDIDHSLENIKFVVYENEKTIKECYVDFLNGSLEIGNIQKDKEYKIKGFMLYDIGDDLIREVDFFETIVQIDEWEYQMLSWEILDDYQNINIKVNTSNPSLQIKKLMIKDKDLSSKYQVVNNYSPFYTSLILSGIVVIGGCGYLFYRKRKQQK